MIDIQKNVNPHFKSVWKSKKPYNILKGGRNSFKSSVVALLLVFKMICYIMRRDKANVVVIRKVGNTIRDSVYLKIQWALRMFGVIHRFKMTVSPFKIEHKGTGSMFYFYGQDDFQKLKSNDIGNIIAVWYEEAAEFASQEDFDQSNVTFMRQKHPKADFVQFFWSYNPPRNPYSWINEWAEELKENPDYLVHESSYLDDELGFVTDQMLADIERIKQNDYDYYRYIYLGEPVGLGTNVYNIDLFQRIEKIPDGERVIGQFFAMDTGHAQSATTCLHLVTTNKRTENNKSKIYLVDNYYYSPAGKANKKAPSVLTREVYEFMKRQMVLFPNAPIVKQTIDSAEGALRNQFLEDYRVSWHPVAKKKKIVMTEFVQSLLAEGRFFYLPSENNLRYFIEEHKKYMWDEKTVMNDDPKVVKEDDHTCDALQYFVIDNASLLELKT
ncbi:PBSX family phage terminase large subunit [Streptococcus cuniculi]|uniref:PBSX family phage terminase large subunit n=1 Tax=Streptococcus cuniculi TaxID=1432788 RepID=A0A4Y9JA65_9STRE|nr:PBSX family phage terminase large subunit [Streptococcus cuniculi]MBF0778171.1 PBSX family phage terminase large subunit [Streptococcus cuniculi]TFU97913.1 PBSX family phage terminase large subunit [Streptococcus cuniculi]